MLIVVWKTFKEYQTKHYIKHFRYYEVWEFEVYEPKNSETI